MDLKHDGSNKLNDFSKISRLLSDACIPTQHARNLIEEPGQ